MEYISTLDPGPKKFICPGCGQKTLVCFINKVTGEYLPDHVGRCDRANNCGYNYHAKDYFSENPDQRPARNNYQEPEPPKGPRFIPDGYVESTLGFDENNSFYKYLKKLFSKSGAEFLMNGYQVGTLNEKWPGAAVFWINDQQNKARSGQIVLFDETGHTVKFKNTEGETIRRTRWIHKHLEHLPSRPAWLTEYLENPECWPCLFGEHLLLENPGERVALVEAPKTAIIAAVYFPQFVWLAVGSMGNFSVNRQERLQALKGRDVVLFPDIGAFDDWSQKAAALAHIARFTVADFLEKNATDADRKNGLDLADFLTRFPISKFSKKLEVFP